MITRARVRRFAVALAATALLPVGMLATAPSAAAATYTGKTTASLNVRSAPTSYAAKVGSLRSGATIRIACKVYGPSVGGNSLWYKLGDGRWIAARYVSNIGAAPRFCGNGSEYVGRVASATSLSVRSGPHTSHARVSSVPRGHRIAIVCKVNSQSVGGNARWYQLTGDGGGQWVAARYVTNVGSAPPYC